MSLLIPNTQTLRPERWPSQGISVCTSAFYPRASKSAFPFVNQAEHQPLLYSILSYKIMKHYISCWLTWRQNFLESLIERFKNENQHPGRYVLTNPSLKALRSDSYLCLSPTPWPPASSRPPSRFAWTSPPASTFTHLWPLSLRLNTTSRSIYPLLPFSLCGLQKIGPQRYPHPHP